MNPESLLEEVRARGISLWVEEGRLRYRAPAGVMNEEMRANLARHRGELLELLQTNSDAVPSVGNGSIPRAQDEGEMPLSFAQERLWFLEQLQPGNPAYQLVGVVRVQGGLDWNACERAIQEVVKRHDILRTDFSQRKGRPVQRVRSWEWETVPMVDLKGLPPTRRDAEAKRQAAIYSRRPFALERDRLWRLVLFELDGGQRILVYALHHIIADAWSIDLLFREMGILYGAFVQGQPPCLPPLPIQYGDYAVWQRQTLNAAAMRNEANYWTKRFAGWEGPVGFPRDFSRPAVRSGRGDRWSMDLGTGLRDRLQHLAREERLTLFMIVLATFKTLILRLARTTDIVVGTPVAGRSRWETQGLIGFFVNTLPLRTHLHGALTFRQALRRVRETVLEGFARQELPFEKLVQAVSPNRSLSETPLVQVMFVFRTGMKWNADWPGLRLELMEETLPTSKFDITFELQESQREFRLVIEYDTDLYRRSAVVRLAQQYRLLLEACAADPDRPLREVALLTDVERRAALNEPGQPSAEFAPAKCLHELFEEQVAQRPDAVAVTFEGENISYRETNRRANQLARHLRALGVMPGANVGLSVDRSLELAVGILGILKTGAAYVPLDPTYPAARLQWIAKDAGLRVLVAKTKLLDQKMIESLRIDIVNLDDDWSEISRRKGGGLCPIRSDSEQIAYIIYTSGSTGQPKGTLVRHRNVIGLFRGTTASFGFGHEDVWTLFHSYGFDFSVWEMWGAWIHGGRLVVVPFWTSRLPEAFCGLLERERVTVLNQTPSAFWQLMEVERREPERKLNLKWVIFGGEALEINRLKTWIDRHGTRRPALVNMYGITETTVHVTHRLIQPDDLSGGSVIGRPIEGWRLYVLDDGGEVAPRGLKGELFVGGTGVACGYAGRSDLTAERFLPDPWAAQPGARLYRSGDLGRYLENGEIEYLGRKDDQVKIRGFRIELGEIETQLRRHPSVVAALVIAREDEAGQKRIAAYAVLKDEQAEAGAPEALLRQFLAETLPEYMVPASVVVLEAFPLTEHGKIDRKALPDPKVQRRKRDSINPVNAAQETLADIWKEVLRLESVSVDDNFFELGGDSILSLQIVARASQRGLRLTLKDLFAHQTIAELAEAAETLDDGGPATASRLCGPVELTPIQRWLFAQELAAPEHYNQALLLRVQRSLAFDTVSAVLIRMVENHDAFRMRFFRGEEGTWRQVCESRTPDGELFEVDLGSLDLERQRDTTTAVCEQLQRSLHLTNGPLVRFAWIRLGATQSPLFFAAIHHLVTDGVSWRILLDDLQSGCRQWTCGQPLPPARPGSSYADWAASLLAYAGSARAKEELDFWRRMHSAPRMSLPVDRRCGENTVGSAASVEIFLTEEETEILLRRFYHSHQFQPDHVLLSALIPVLARWMNSETVTVDLEGHGRHSFDDALDISRTIGWFTAIYPVAFRWEPDLPLLASIQSLKEQLKKIPHGGTGFGVLRCQPWAAEAAPIFAAGQTAEVSYNYFGQLDQALAAEDSFFSPCEEACGAAKNPGDRRSHLLEITAWAHQQRLIVKWTFSENVHDRESIQALAQAFARRLRLLLSACLAGQTGGEPAEFSLADLSRAELERAFSIAEFESK